MKEVNSTEWICFEAWLWGQACFIYFILGAFFNTTAVSCSFNDCQVC